MNDTTVSSHLEDSEMNFLFQYQTVITSKQSFGKKDKHVFEIPRQEAFHRLRLIFAMKDIAVSC